MPWLAPEKRERIKHKLHAMGQAMARAGIGLLKSPWTLTRFTGNFISNCTPASASSTF